MQEFEYRCSADHRIVHRFVGEPEVANAGHAPTFVTCTQVMDGRDCGLEAQRIDEN